MSEPSPETILIDGYNLLRRGFRFLEEEHGLEAARTKLEVRLREFLRAAGPALRIRLIYDGAETPVPEESASRAEPGLEVVFSRPHETADEAILAEIGRAH